MDDDRRRQSRWRHSTFVAYVAPSVRGEGQLCNVSETGVFVRTDRPPRPGESIELRFDVDDTELVLAGSVRWRGRRHDGGEGFGVKLVDPPAEYLGLVRSLALTRTDESAPRRVAPRVEISLPVAVELGNSCDAGVLTDISLSGARLERTGVRPTLGEQVRLTFSLDEGQSFEVVARVVRVVEPTGYAVQFEALDAGFKAALVHATSLLTKLPDTPG